MELPPQPAPRGQVDQAIETIAAVEQCSASDAADALMVAARHAQLDVDDLAADIVAARRLALPSTVRTERPANQPD